MFSDNAEAKWWLKQAAMVKYVDGAWLGHINKISTPFKYRKITKNAWQVMSEELGDGDLAKNHVYVYQKLMESISARLPAADSKDFIHSRHGMSEARCWKAAVAQLLISLFANEFLPEALGFNMAYESLPLHLLKTIKELRELRIDPYYFELHVSIDNADSGHAAIAMAAVKDYIELVEQNEGKQAAHVAWKRVQAGYILAEGLPTTPESPSTKAMPEKAGDITNSEKPVIFTEVEATMLSIFTAKSSVAHKIHCNSRLKIGRRSLVDWLEPNAFLGRQWQREFLQDLGDCNPWVIRGSSATSRLVKELSWEGRMFGSFTQTEVKVVEKWIDHLDSPTPQIKVDPKVYLRFTEQSPKISASGSAALDILVHYPVFSELFLTANSSRNRTGNHVGNSFPIGVKVGKLDPHRLLPLWFTSLTLLESLPSVPVRAADTFGSAIVRILRAQNGFGRESFGVAGMDEVRRTDDGQAVGIVELGLEICRRVAINEPQNLTEAVAIGDTESKEFSEWMMWRGMRWLTNRDVLVGMTWRFMELHQAVAQFEEHKAFLSTKSNTILYDIAVREKRGLEFCLKEIEKDEQRVCRFREGIAISHQAIESCYFA